MKTIGYIGTGIMGAAMAENLLKSGFEVVVWNRTREKADRLIELGAKWAGSPAEVAGRVEAVCLNVTDTRDVEEVVFGPRGVVEGNPGNTADFLVVDHSTISAEATRGFAARLAELGSEFVDAPVTGGDVGARNATLSIMVGGSAAAFERVLPMLRTVGKTITHMGPVGSGQATKACNQVMVAVNLLGVCEAMALAMGEGLDLSKVIEVTGGGGAASWQLNNLGPRIVRGDMKPGFMIDLINKDLNLVYQEAQSLGVPMPALRLAAELFKSAAATGRGRDGTQAVCRVYGAMGASMPGEA